MKKIILLLSMLVFTFSMTACSDGQEKVDFDYTDMDILNNSLILTYNILSLDEASKTVIDNSEGQEIYRTAISNFESADEECGNFSGFRTQSGGVLTFDDILNASGEDETGNAYNQCLLMIDSEIKEDGDVVNAELTAVFGERDVKLRFMYEGAPEKASLDEATGIVTVPFKISEVTVSPEYTFNEKMAKAGMNTLMGMATVFSILILIALIIGQFERLSKVIIAVSEVVGNLVARFRERRAARKAGTQETEETVQAQPKETAVAAAPSASEDLIGDTELVAVITAAIMASEGMTVSAGSDGLIVRSIRKAKR